MDPIEAPSFLLVPKKSMFKAPGATCLTQKKTMVDTRTKLDIPIDEDGTKEEFIWMIYEFNQVATQFSWLTGPQYFNNFKLHLKGNACMTWDTIAINANQMISRFQEALQQFKGHKFISGNALEV